MGASPFARQAPILVPRHQSEQPATLAFRRPPDHRASPAAIRLSEQPSLPPIVLRLPDLHAPEPVEVLRAADAYPLAGKLMWCGSGVLAVVAVWLLIVGRPETPPAAPEAPRWQSSETAADSADPSLGSAVHRPVANWKMPRELNAANPSNVASRGPWRADAQVVQPGAVPEVDANQPEQSAAAGSASWPGDAWPGRRADTYPGQEPAPTVPADNNASGAARSGEPPLPSVQNAVPGPGARTTPDDPWPGPPQWSDEARRSAGGSAEMRTAQRPARTAPASPAEGPRAQLDGGIRNLDVSPNYDAAR